jgi:hypothetical protein
MCRDLQHPSILFWLDRGGRANQPGWTGRPAKRRIRDWSRFLPYVWATVQYLARDQRRVEDVDSSGPDHATDACRYGCLYQRPVMGVIDLRWATRQRRRTWPMVLRALDEPLAPALGRACASALQRRVSPPGPKPFEPSPLTVPAPVR